MKRILFYGDSNTWGYDPVTTRRFPDHIRFTGLLEKRLSECKIIEEGLKGRNNSLDDDLEEGRNGYKSLPMILCSHDPIDIFVIMLGSNDVKTKFQNSALEIADALAKNVRLVQTPHLWGGVDVPQILIICPPGITEDFKGDRMEGYFDERSIRISKELAQEYQKVAELLNCEYLNAMEFTDPGKIDGVHLDEEGHRKLADAIEIKLNEMMKN